MERSADVAVVVVAHGSRAEAANDAHRAFCRAVGESAALEVTAAFLETGEPSLGDAIDQVAAGGAHRVVIAPHFLAPGNHTVRDIPAAVDEATTHHPELECEILSHTGALAALPSLVGADLVAALEIDSDGD